MLIGGLIAFGRVLQLVTSASSPPFLLRTEGRELVVTSSVEPGVHRGDRLVALGGELPRTAQTVDVDAVRARLAAGAAEARLVRVEAGRADTIAVELRLVRPRGPQVLMRPVWTAIGTLIAGLGWIVARASAATTGRREFILLAIATASSVVPTLARTLVNPSLTAMLPGEPQIGLGYWNLVWPVFYGIFLLRFLLRLRSSGVGADGARWLFGWRPIVLVVSFMAAMVIVANVERSLVLLGAAVGGAAALLPLAVLVRAASPRRALVRLAVAATLALGALAGVVFWRWSFDMRATIAALRQAAPFVFTFVAVVGAVVWPIVVWRVAREVEAHGGVSALQTRTVTAGIRFGAWLLLGLMANLILYVAIAAAAAPAVPQWLDLMTPLLLALLWVAIALPFVGVFLAVTRHGMWNADLIFRRLLGSSGFAVLFLALWEVCGFLFESRLQGFAGGVGAAVAVGGALVALQKPLRRLFDRLVFPAASDIRPRLDALVRQRGSSGTIALDRELCEALRAETVVAVRLLGPELAVARRSSSQAPSPAVAVAVTLPALTSAEHAVVIDGDAVRFAFRIGSAPLDGMLLVEPARRSRLYDARERSDIALVASLLGDRWFRRLSEAGRLASAI